MPPKGWKKLIDSPKKRNVGPTVGGTIKNVLTVESDDSLAVKVYNRSGKMCGTLVVTADGVAIMEAGAKVMPKAVPWSRAAEIMAILGD